MKRYSISILAVGFAALILSGCNKPINKPTDKSILFQFDVQYHANPQPNFLIRQKESPPIQPVGKNVNLQAINLVRVMVIDFSAYDSWGDVVSSSWWTEYQKARDNWKGNRASWAEWKKFLGDYMNIVADQNLEIKSGEAVGMVAGVKGLNRILVGLFDDNVIKYMGEGDGVGVEGETRKVTIQTYPWDGSGNTVTLSSIEIKPDSTLLFSNQTQQFVCVARYSDWSTDTLTSQVTWSVSPGTFGSINSSGRFQAGLTTEGNEKIKASFQGKQDSAKVKVVRGAPGDMILIPAGSFLMGKNSTSGQPPDYHPAHTVYLDAYYIDRFSVTCSQYAVFLNSAIATGKVQVNAGSAVKDGHILFSPMSSDQLQYANGQFVVVSGTDNFPMIRVSWWGAEAYTAYYNKRLPTEAEWEKAARGTDGREYPWGNTPPTPALCNYSWYLKPVGWYHPLGDSPYGLSDMAGNAYQWVNDWYGDTYYATSPTNNPKGPTTGTEKALRGGDAFSYSNQLTCYARGRNPIDEYRQIFGFRCAKNP